MKKYITIFLACFLSATVSYAADASDNWSLAAQKTEQITKLCEEKALTGTDGSVASSLAALNTEIQCLKQYAGKEIQKGFSAKEQSILQQQIDNLLSAVKEFYHHYYFASKYCPESCGSIGRQFADNEQTEILTNVLKKLIYLNLQNSPY